MSCTRELAPWSFSLNITSGTASYIWEDAWYPCMGVSTVDFLADVRNISTAGGASVSLLPAIQLAAVRPDRPAAGAGISGTAISAVGATHFQATLSAGSYFFFRRGFTYKLTGGTPPMFGQADVTLYTSFRACGTVFPSREIVFNPLDTSTDASFFPLTGPIPATGVSAAKLAIVGLDNTSDDLQYAVYARAFNDKMARGSWSTALLDFSSTDPAVGDFEANTGELSFTGLTLSNYQWVELALGVKTTDAGDPPRVIFHVIPAISYS